MPSHNHNITIIGNEGIKEYGVRLAAEWRYGELINNFVSYTGSDYYHNNIQPYLVVYMYKRTA